jgi:hypothetical protein
MTYSRLAAAAALIAVFLGSTLAHAEIELKWSGRIQTDIRFRVEDKSVGPWYGRREAKPGISRNDNTFRLKLVANSEQFTGVAEFDFSYYGFAIDLDGFNELWRREIVDSFRIEAQGVYIEARDLLIPGLDVRIGQQVVAWGVGDQFNPTNVINPLDLEDPLLFGEQLSNVMLKADYSPDGNFVASLVMVPIFRPALLNRTSGLGLALTQRLPYINDALRHRIHTESWFSARTGNPSVLERAIVVTPETSLDNIQWAARLAYTVGSHDFALMFYSGRFDIPQPFASYAEIDSGERCNPIDPGDCVNGITRTYTGLTYPKMMVLGFNATGELPNPLSLLFKGAKAIGYRFELGVYFPRRVNSRVLNNELSLGGITLPPGEYDYQLPGGGAPLVIDDTPFAKWVVGLDYTFSSNIYLNVQWVHGLADEYGAGDFFNEGWVVRDGYVDTNRFLGAEGQCAIKVLSQNTGSPQDFSQCAREILRPRLGDYLVAGLDLKFRDQKGLLRLFMIWDLNGVHDEFWDPDAKARVRKHHGPFTKKGFSMIIFPELSYNFGSGFVLGAGALIALGRDYSKFGDPAAGGTVIFTRGQLAF